MTSQGITDDGDEDHYFHIDGTDQAFVTQKAIDLLRTKLCHFIFSIVGIIIEANDVHDVYGHAFHCTDSAGHERIVFNLTSHMNFRIIMDEHSYYGVMELKNVKSKGDDLHISLDHWISGKAPPAGTTLNQCKAALTSYKLKNFVYKIIIPFREELVRTLCASRDSSAVEKDDICI